MILKVIFLSPTAVFKDAEKLQADLRAIPQSSFGDLLCWRTMLKDSILLYDLEYSQQVQYIRIVHPEHIQYSKYQCQIEYVYSMA